MTVLARDFFDDSLLGTLMGKQHEQSEGGHHDTQAQGQGEDRPLLRSYLELAGRDDVGNVARDEQAAGEQETEQDVPNLPNAHLGADLGGGERGVVQDGAGGIDPVEGQGRHAQDILVHRGLKPSPRKTRAMMKTKTLAARMKTSR